MKMLTTALPLCSDVRTESYRRSCRRLADGADAATGADAADSADVTALVIVAHRSAHYLFFNNLSKFCFFDMVGDVL
jgi:hypothetical protein